MRWFHGKLYLINTGKFPNTKENSYLDLYGVEWLTYGVVQKLKQTRSEKV